MNQPALLDPRAIIAAFDWWKEAGVDYDFVDNATDWLAEPAIATVTEAPTIKSATPVSPAEAPPPISIDLLGDNPPDDLAKFREWWLTEPSLDTIGPRGRIPPRGEAGARLMVVVMDPEQGDTDYLLSGPQGRLLSRALAAMSYEESEIYLASALPRHTPMADGLTLASQGFSEILQHHIKLAAPQAVLAFGSNILPLLGHEATQEPASLKKIEHESFNVPFMAAEGLDAMIAMPRLKARFWSRWLEWTGAKA